MKMNIPYEKEIVFNTKIAEITSISLEHEANVLNDCIEGEFIVSGDYKIHELSVNKEPFKYRIPFSVELADNMIRDTINYDISNFTYDVIDGDTLKVNIELCISYESVNDALDVKEEVEEPKENESNNEGPTEDIERENQEINTLTKEEIASKELNNLLDDIEMNNNSSIKDNKVNDSFNNSVDNTVKSNEKINSNKEEVVLNNVSNALNTYVTYHIHVLSDGEDINTIANKYKVSKDTISEYNNELEWIMGEKVIIPELQDE